MTTLDGKSLDIEAENIEKLRRIFSEAFEEGKIDFDKLRQLLGDYVDDAEERYRFTWNGKGRALRLSQTPSLGTLRPCKKESKDWDTTQNLYIEGDNLEVLKLLQKSYYGKVKMIYIDPPYNTGGDFVYKDDFRDNIENYKRVTGQVDGEGHKIDTNTESNGRFHTDWLNMMYPRLRLARNLLTEDGVIFISIDDNEQENLKKICDEVFGESNFIAQMVWQKRTSPDARRIISAGHEYVLAYIKNIQERYNILNPLSFDEGDYTRYKNPDHDPNGPWISTDCTAQAGHGTKEQFYDLTTPSGRIVKLQEGLCWRYTEERMKEEIEAGHIWFGIDGKGVPRKKTYLANRSGKTMWTWWPNSEVGHTQEATKELNSILQSSGIMDFPKPLRMMKRIVQISTQSDSLILDFFSGSATTAHAVMQLNAEDGGHRKFIMVQLPEPTAKNSEAAKAGYKNIFEIGKERIRRAGEKILSDAKNKNASPERGGAPEGGGGVGLDVGFKVFKLDSSNLQKWNPQPKDLQLALQESVENFLPRRTELDVVYEIMLKMGLNLALPIEERHAEGQTVYVVGGGALMICLGEHITVLVAEEIVRLRKEYDSELWQVVFRDTGFASDMDKTNIKETLKSAGLDEDSFVCV